MKFRVVDGIPEFEGEPEEIAKMLQKPELFYILTIQQSAQQGDLAMKNPTNLATKPSGKIKIPTSDELFSIIESKGKPFVFSMREEQIRRYGRSIDSKRERRLYLRFFDATVGAKKKIAKKYNGKWVSEREGGEGTKAHTIRYIFEEINDQK